MLKLTNFVLSVAVVALSCTKTFALTKEDKAAIHQFLGPIISDCASKHGVSKAEISGEKKTASKDVNPCYLGCILKTTEFMDNKGYFILDKGLNNLLLFMKSKEEIARYQEVGKICLKVNEENVSDGEAGCERAKLLLKCAVDNKIDVPF